MKIKAAFDLFRLPNLLITAATVYLTFLTTSRIFPTIETFNQYKILGSALTIILMIMAAGNILNDIFDREIDLINRPDKVVVGKSLSIAQAGVLYIALNLLALTVMLFAFLGTGNVIVPSIYASSIFLLYVYSAFLKRIPFWGNITVAILCASSLWIIPLTVDVGALSKWTTDFLPISIFSFFAFCITMVREIIKDLQDMEGDKSKGGRTLATEWPLWKTKSLVSFFMALNLICLVIVTFQMSKGNNLTYIWSLILIISGLFLFYQIHRMCSTKDFANLSRYIKLFMLQGLILFLLWS